MQLFFSYHFQRDARDMEPIHGCCAMLDLVKDYDLFFERSTCMTSGVTELTGEIVSLLCAESYVDRDYVSNKAESSETAQISP